jgi:hypothetical protein
MDQDERASMAAEIAEAMKAKYQEWGETGDFVDGERYLRDEASDAELLQEYAKWVK